jgi:hypothetical protein
MRSVERSVTNRRRKDDEPEPDAGVNPGFPIAPHHVAVLLNQYRVGAQPGDGYEPLEGFILGIEFTVDATGPLAACEIVYSITHSTPGDMHCTEAYRDVIETYRSLAHFRPLTVNDAVEVDGVRYTCARFGFKLVSA